VRDALFRESIGFAWRDDERFQAIDNMGATGITAFWGRIG
jgi:hypothetical protein